MSIKCVSYDDVKWYVYVYVYVFVYVYVYVSCFYVYIDLNWGYTYETHLSERYILSQSIFFCINPLGHV